MLNLADKTHFFGVKGKNYFAIFIKPSKFEKPLSLLPFCPEFCAVLLHPFYRAFSSFLAPFLRFFLML